ncbi:YbfB/YjiJ family MFS transporter [Parashewanella spongiae]|uniref:YbfB/YjiJ family MFS transporter n=1 Tax=Parashewanella spongiae TaxID=342950 RepID=A0A3A6TBT7_9GAMM|nr:YbfB/YjiJ family MFS transporter [Parashewanella spongiae]MCL1079675.1 MFS transporter [Parashewanella spongiae]RJY07051.1 YbfB/YjiJ family MFS transporter [Parashewanella spongiae]
MATTEGNLSKGIFWASFCGLCATVIGLGIGRFSFVPLIPAMISNDWYSEALTGYLGSTTLFGYLLGGLTAHRLSEKIGSANTIKLSMVIVTFVYLGCFQPFSYPWLIFCRLFAGIAGAWIVIITPGYIFHRTDPKYKARISGMIFSGIGLGVVISGYIVPNLLDISLSTAWLGLGAASGLFTLVSWSFWVPLKKLPYVTRQSNTSESYQLNDNPKKTLVIMLLSAYALDAIGYLPHTIYWVHYLVHGLDLSFIEGGHFWVLFGVGAILGPHIMGVAADKYGLANLLVVAFFLKAFAILLPNLSTNYWSLVASSMLVGGLTSGVVSLVSATTLEIVGKQHHKQVWGWMTISFATTQAIMGYGIVLLFTQTMNYSLLFYIGCGCLMASVLIALKLRLSIVH